jgi:CPA2 family monovalent cation:H+ antiporter-2
LPESGLSGHIVIVGSGRVGLYVARLLQQLDLSFVLLELDFRRVEQAKEANLPIIYGDASQEIVLEAAHLETDSLLLLTTPTIQTTDAITIQARHINPNLHIVARAEGLEAMQVLHNHGVTEVVQPEFEASLEMARQALLHFNIPPSEIYRFTDSIRHQLYTPLYEDHAHYQAVAQLQNASRLLPLNWKEIPGDSPLIGQTIKTAAIRTRTGASIVGILHNSALITNPDSDYSFAPGDKIAIMGSFDQLAIFDTLLVEGSETD